MIPEFKFKRRDTYQVKKSVKEFIREKFADRRIRYAGTAAAAGVLIVSLAVLAVPSKETVKKENITALLQVQTAGVTTQINNNENQLQEQANKLSISKMSDVAKTGTSLDAVAGFNADAVANESVEDEIAAEAASEAIVAAATQPAAAAVPEEQEPVEPVHPQLVGFSNPGIANVEQYVNIRVKPNENSTICGKLNKNTACEILDEQEGWYHIITNGVEGYVKAEYLITGEEAWQLADQLKYPYVRVITETLYVREAPSTDSKIIELASNNQKLGLVEEQAEWVKVQIDGKEGYLNKSYIAVEYTLPKGEAVKVEKKESKEEKESKDSKSGSKSSKNGSSVVDYATQFVGNPYVYGGTSLTRGADCSGFTMSVYAKFGVYLPHSSAAQSKCGTKVSASELQPGDLIFYGSGSSVNHVALYIGGGKIVHASTEKTGIKISNAFYRTPVTIRRVR